MPVCFCLEFVANCNLCTGQGKNLPVLAVCLVTTKSSTNTYGSVDTPEAIELEVVTVAYAKTSCLNILQYTTTIGREYFGFTEASSLSKSTEVVTIESFAEVVTTSTTASQPLR